MTMAELLVGPGAGLELTSSATTTVAVAAATMIAQEIFFMSMAEKGKNLTNPP